MEGGQLMRATRVGTVTVLSSDEYVCGRCGRQGECTSSRPKPKLCADCHSVIRYREPEPPAERTQLPGAPDLSDAECLAARKAFRLGDRSPGVEEGAREYWRRADARKRANRRRELAS